MIADAHISSLRHATLLAPTEVRCVATWARHAYNGCAADPGGEYYTRASSAEICYPIKLPESPLS